MSEPHRDRTLFDNAAAALKSDMTAASVGAEWEHQVRTQYRRQIDRYIVDLKSRATAGRISWRAAIDEANEMRVASLRIMRRRSTPVGRALAQNIKRESPGLNFYIAKYSQKLFGAGADFNRLTTAQRNRVYAEVVSGAGRDNAGVTAKVRIASRVGRGLLIFSLAVSVYTVLQSEDRVAAAKREGAVTGAGIAGGIAGGALAGLACGPGAPVCVGIGAFVGGTLAAFGVDHFW